MSRMKLTDYEISMKTGFILEDPLTWLPPYFARWNYIAINVAQLIRNKSLTESVQELPVLDYTRLKGEKQIKLGHLQLGFISAGYLWQNGVDPALVPKTLPKGVAVPLYGLYKEYGLAPILTYADMFTSNCAIIDPSKPLTAENLSPIYNVPGGEDWRWFFGADMAAEYAFAPSIQGFQNVLDGVDENDEGKMTEALQQLAEGVRSMKERHSVLHEKLPVESFVVKLSQYVSGYGDGPLPDGLVFEGVETEPVKMAGPNAGHTPVFKALDALLGIEHQPELHEYTETKFLYMYPSHRRFIYDLRKRPVQLKTVVQSSTNAELKKAFDELVQAITNFRSYHIQIVAKYVFLAMNRTMSEEQLNDVKSFKEFTIKYLKGMRDDSQQGITSS